MFEQRKVYGDTPAGTLELVDEKRDKTDKIGEQRRRHAVLMELLDEERDRQGEERMQAAIDEDFYDHLQWKLEDAQALIERGQAPLVFNEARQTIDWIAGMQKRMRSDYKILPRGKDDSQGAETKTQVVKYTDDVNRTAWHVSKAFKQATISGLSWLEENINVEPGEELIYSGSEDWRNVFRDSRAKDLTLRDGRYLFRRKVLDTDYAIALLPKAEQHLRNVSTTDDHLQDDEVWYLGERLTGASDIGREGLSGSYRDRTSYVGTTYSDRGRRGAVEILECMYRVPQRVEVFQDGPLSGKVFNPAEPGHRQLKEDRWRMYESVTQRMRVMLATKDEPLWDGPSPFRHSRFLLVPVWAYRRYRDGMAYGVMRGMRDLQEDTNKRASKALWMLSSNRLILDTGVTDDVEKVRQEWARADGVIEKPADKKIEAVQAQGEVAMNLEMMDRNTASMRRIGGVTEENLGHKTNATSGIAIERRQDQGSLTTSELFDNLRLAKLTAGEMRLAHIDQFMTQPKVIRITGENQPVQWLEVNKVDPVTGQILNDIAATACDYVVAEQDYRESYARAALEQMMELLGQIAQYAPNVVLAVLDLVVDSADVRNKDEWISRIRKINGQRDPTKEMTPEEMAAEKSKQAKAALVEKVELGTIQAQLQEMQAKVAKLDADAIVQRVHSIMSALQAAQAAVVAPGAAPVADEVLRSAGFQDKAGDAAGLPAAQAATQSLEAGAPPQGVTP